MTVPDPIGEAIARSRAAQGLSPQIEDEAALEMIARLVLAHQPTTPPMQIRKEAA
jgi:hypothetical protein